MPVNNPTTDLVVLNAVANVMLPGSVIASQDPTNQGGLGLVFIEDLYALSLSQTPAVHLSAGNQPYQRNSLRTYIGQLTVEVCYYKRWDQTPETIAQIRKDIAADLEVLKGNLESNESLAFGAQAYAVSIPRITLSPFKGAIDGTFPNFSAIRREMFLTINLLPYDV